MDDLDRPNEHDGTDFFFFFKANSSHGCLPFHDTRLLSEIRRPVLKPRHDEKSRLRREVGSHGYTQPRTDFPWARGVRRGKKKGKKEREVELWSVENGLRGSAKSLPRAGSFYRRWIAFDRGQIFFSPINDGRSNYSFPVKNSREFGNTSSGRFQLLWFHTQRIIDRDSPVL